MGVALVAALMHQAANQWLELYANAALYPLFLFNEITRQHQ